ncbi:hypothetical protein L6R52_12345 [Myxococcota bacterium]|nr:hypothetical protein [Myxococcota bacterium]
MSLGAPRRASTCLAVLALASAAGCRAEITFDVSYRSDAIERSVTDLRAFVFAAPDDAAAGTEPPSCERLDPRGLGPGDAEARTGRTALHTSRGAPRSPILEVAELPEGRYTVVIEAWGPRCEELVDSASSDEPACGELATDGATVLRGYRCLAVDARGRSQGALDATLETFASIGSVMRVPSLEVRYGDADPLPVVDGLEADDDLVVQLLASNGDPVDDARVHWGTSRGFGGFDAPQPLVTGADDVLSDRGISRAVLRAGLTASSVDDGVITVTAYAPGYDGAPITFAAKAVRSTRVELEEHTLPPELETEATFREFQPLVVDDLDRDGRADVALVGYRGSGCSGESQLGVLYGRDDGRFDAAWSGFVPGLVRAMTSARVGGDRRVLVQSKSTPCGVEANTEAGPAVVVRAPALDVWSDLELRPSPGDPALGATRQTFGQALDCTRAPCADTPAPLRKAAISIDAADVDGDGVDELAVARCSYLRARSGGQNPIVPCIGLIEDRTDSEVALVSLDVEGGVVTGLRDRATVGGRDGDGGYREVRLVDLNGDGSLDLAWAAQTLVSAVCGRRNMPATGFGFHGAERTDVSITFAQGFSVAGGRFDDVPGDDVVVTGGLRATGVSSGLKLAPGGGPDGCTLAEGEPPMLTGPRAYARSLIARSADLNGDGWSDVILLHREERRVMLFFGTGTERLARGPAIDLPATATAELGLWATGSDDGAMALAATIAPEDERLFVLHLRPAPR